MKEARYKVTANGNDITKALASRLLKLTVSDAAGSDSDTVAIELDNRDGVVRLPETGAELEVWIGDTDSLVYKGVFEVDELEVPLDDQVFSIHAKAVKMKGSLKAPKDETFDNITLGDLAAKIAASHGYDVKVSPELAGITYEHLDQKSESDMNLLSRLAREAGGFFKPVANKLVIVAKGEGKSVSGKALPEVVIDDPENTSGRVTIQKRSDYQSVVVNWFDEINQVEVQEVAGSGEPQYKIRRNYPNKDEAQRAAKAKLDGFQRGQASIDFTRPLTASLAPETKITFANHNSAANKTWLIETIEHSIEGSGVSSTSGRGITPKD